MHIKEQIIMNHLAFELLQHDNYEILHINENQNEIWLEKYENRISKLVRITTVGFDWKNELKRDIAQVFTRVGSMGNLLLGKTVDIKNIYVSEYSPVDSWHKLKRPISYKSGKQMNMNLYYLNKEDYQEEIDRISKDIFHISSPELDLDPAILQANLQNYQLFLNKSLVSKRKRAEEIFSYGRPIFTYLLLAMNIIYFMVIELLGSSMDIPHLIQFGAKYNPLIMDFEWWRIISSMFIHIGFIHLFMNMLALYYLGTAVERIYGPMKFLFIYFLAGIVGGLASFAFTINVSAGASGAIFGLFGALLFFGLHERKIFLQTIGRSIIFIIVFNVIFGFMAPQIDNSAHIGGLIAGFIGSAIFHLPERRDLSKQILAGFAYLVIVGFLISYGLNNGDNIASYKLYKIENFVEEEKYDEVIKLSTESLDYTEEESLLLKLYFHRSVGYINKEEYHLAIDDLNQTIEIEKKFHPSYYNLALLYNEIGDYEKAKESIEIAYSLNKDDEKYVNLYIEIIGNKPD